MINPPPTGTPLNKAKVQVTMANVGMSAKARNESAPAQTISPEWQEFFSAIYFAVSAMQQSGTTAQRPTKKLYIGRPYFDTTLNRPIWYTGTNWIRADGVVV